MLHRTCALALGLLAPLPALAWECTFSDGRTISIEPNPHPNATMRSRWTMQGLDGTALQTHVPVYLVGERAAISDQSAYVTLQTFGVFHVLTIQHRGENRPALLSTFSSNADRQPIVETGRGSCG